MNDQPLVGGFGDFCVNLSEASVQHCYELIRSVRTELLQTMLQCCGGQLVDHKYTRLGSFHYDFSRGNQWPFTIFGGFSIEELF